MVVVVVVDGGEQHQESNQLSFVEPRNEGWMERRRMERWRNARRNHPMYVNKNRRRKRQKDIEEDKEAKMKKRRMRMRKYRLKSKLLNRGLRRKSSKRRRVKSKAKRNKPQASSASPFNSSFSSSSSSSSSPSFYSSSSSSPFPLFLSDEMLDEGRPKNKRYLETTQLDYQKDHVYKRVKDEKRRCGDHTCEHRGRCDTFPVANLTNKLCLCRLGTTGRRCEKSKGLLCGMPVGGVGGVVCCVECLWEE